MILIYYIELYGFFYEQDLYFVKHVPSLKLSTLYEMINMQHNVGVRIRWENKFSENIGFTVFIPSPLHLVRSSRCAKKEIVGKVSYFMTTIFALRYCYEAKYQKTERNILLFYPTQNETVKKIYYLICDTTFVLFYLKRLKNILKFTAKH